jgi:hypothetical protein
MPDQLYSFSPCSGNHLLELEFEINDLQFCCLLVRGAGVQLRPSWIVVFTELNIGLLLLVPPSERLEPRVGRQKIIVDSLWAQV